MAEMRGKIKETGIQVVHSTAGRVRLRSRCLSQEALRTAAALLKQQEGVYQVKLNENTGSLVVNFDVASVSSPSLLSTLAGKNCNSTMLSPSSASQAKSSSSANSFQKVAGEVRERLIPLTSGILITRALGISGWLSLPIYIATAAITREMLQQLPPLVEEEQEKEKEKRTEQESKVAEQEQEKEVNFSQILTLALAAKAFETLQKGNVQLENNSARGNSSRSQTLEPNLNGHRSLSVETIEPNIKEETNNFAPVFSEEKKLPLNQTQVNGLWAGYKPSILWCFLDSIANMPDLSTEVIMGG
ncbi:MAG: hypothetical protein QNJ38_13900 [Prochloraceae cyanobacterium]|nr:hypothetical protein [Prochloraceae cyanobacterium]